MRTSPKVMAIVYFFTGILFTYLATYYAEETIWNFSTMLLAFIATFDFGCSIRLMSLHFRLKQSNKKE